MAKDPAFLFYSSDFLTGVMTLSFEDRGKYITLLCAMHQQGRLHEETIRFLVGSFPAGIQQKFLKDENGLWYNRRLEEEIDKRKNFVQTRRANGKKGGRPKEQPTAKPNDNPLTQPDGEMKNEDEITIADEEKGLQREEVQQAHHNPTAHHSPGHPEPADSAASRHCREGLEPLQPTVYSITHLMLREWMVNNPTYPKNAQDDLPALRDVYHFLRGKILEYKKPDRANHDVITASEDELLTLWNAMCGVVMKQKFWKNKSLRSIAAHKQEFFQKLTHQQHDTGNKKWRTETAGPAYAGPF